jgi:hypothetical protein
MVVSAAVLPLLPSATCPLCLAAYAGILSSLGLGFLMNDQVQKPLILVFLGITLASVAFSAKQHRRFGPLLLVLSGAVAIVAARIVWNIPWVVYLGVAFLVAGAGWNFVLKRVGRRLNQIRLAQARSTHA